jgi:hypothetical protein
MPVAILPKTLQVSFEVEVVKEPPGHPKHPAQSPQVCNSLPAVPDCKAHFGSRSLHPLPLKTFLVD